MRVLVRNGLSLRKVCSCSYPVLTLIRSRTETMKYLNVAEKNDAAKNISLHLSRGTSRRV